MIKCEFENGGKANLRHIVVHAIVEKDNKLLLEKRASHLSEGGKWSLPAGFLDRDENAAEGILRELKEETGWTGEIVSLFRINTDPNRPHEDRQNVALEFIIKPLQKVGELDHETDEIRWVPLKEITSFKDFAFDHGETIKLYIQYREKHFPRPLFL